MKCSRSREQPSPVGGAAIYKLVNIRTGAVVGVYKSKARARLWLDRRDNEYGAYVHQIQVITKSQP